MKDYIIKESNIQLYWFGKIEYNKALKLQKKYISLIQQNDPYKIVIMGLEHFPVITLGKRGDYNKDVNVERKYLLQKKISIFSVDRGGQATIHLPGQLIIYPIIPLRKYNISVRYFVRLLEKITMNFLQNIQINSYPGKDEPGIYTNKGKIAFFGLRIVKGVSMHGLSINAYNDLNLFNLIRSCGKKNETFDKIENYGIESNLKNLFQQWTEIFKEKILN